MSTDGHQSTKKSIDALISSMQIHAETLGLRGAFQINNRQVLPSPMIAHIKANGSATVAGNRYARGRAWRIAWPSRTRF